MIQRKKPFARVRDRVLFLPAAAMFFVITAAVVWHWWRDNPGMSAAGRASAVASALLFFALCIAFLWHWISDWDMSSGNKAESITHSRIGAAPIVKIFLSLLALEGAVVFFVYVLRIALKEETVFREALDFWTCADSRHYLAIAEDWYLSEGSLDRLVQLVFLPGYPLAVRAVYPLVHEYLYAGMIVSSVSFAGAGTVLYCLARLDMDHDTAVRALRYACILPGAFFYAAPMSESLFLLLSVSCIYLSRKKMWFPACLLGGLAAFTRSLGLVLAVPVGYELITDSRKYGLRGRGLLRRLPQYASLLLIPAGFGVYCLICKEVSGDPFQWAIYQREHWNQQLGLFFHTAAYQTENAINAYHEQDLKLMLGLWLPNLICSFSALAIMAVSIRKLRPSYGAYFIAYYVIAIGATWLLSAPRYLLVLFPIAFGMAEITGNRHIDALLTILTASANVLYTLLFAARWQVW